MKIFLLLTISLLALVSLIQNKTIERQRQTIWEMKDNPACMVAPSQRPTPHVILPERNSI